MAAELREANPRARASGRAELRRDTRAAAQLVLAAAPSRPTPPRSSARRRSRARRCRSRRARQASSPSRPKRELRASQPATAPGTVTESGPRSATGASGSAPAGAGPAASSPTSSPSCQTHRERVAAEAGRHRLRHAENRRGREHRVDGVAAAFERAQARHSVARCWLVATIASSATAGLRPKAWRNATARQSGPFRPGSAPVLCRQLAMTLCTGRMPGLTKVASCVWAQARLVGSGTSRTLTSDCRTATISDSSNCAVSVEKAISSVLPSVATALGRS